MNQEPKDLKLKSYFDSLKTPYSLKYIEDPKYKAPFYVMLSANGKRAAHFELEEDYAEEDAQKAIRHVVARLDKDLTNKPEVLE